MNTPDTATDENYPPFACNLLALSHEVRTHHMSIAREMFDAVQSVQELPDGVSLQFRPQAELLPLLAQFVGRERLCCPFFAFTLKVEPEGGPFWLSITGRNGVKEFLEAQLNLSALAGAQSMAFGGAMTRDS